MRGKRTRQCRKLMHQYSLSFGLREPYQVLVTASIVLDAARFKIDLVAALNRTVQGTVKPMITQCCMRHLYTTKDQNLIEGARRFERRRCGHHELEQPLPALECLESCVDPKGTGTNSHRYIVAVQEPEIRAKMREIPGVPLIYINRSIVILEPMAGVTRDVMERGERAKLRMGVRGKLTVGKRKLDGEGGTLPSEETSGQVGRDRKEYLVQKKRKRSKGPNPLSVKKPKKRAL